MNYHICHKSSDFRIHHIQNTYHYQNPTSHNWMNQIRSVSYRIMSFQLRIVYNGSGSSWLSLSELRVILRLNINLLLCIIITITQSAFSSYDSSSLLSFDWRVVFSLGLIFAYMLSVCISQYCLYLLTQPYSHSGQKKEFEQGVFQKNVYFSVLWTALCVYVEKYVK